MATKEVKTIDISNWQGQIDFAKVKAAGVERVIIKVTEGIDYVDPRCSEYVKGAKDAGLEMEFYHFGHPENHATPDQSVKHFVETVKSLGVGFGHAMNLDLEKGTGDLTNWADSFLSQLKQQTGGEVRIYVSSSFAKEHLGAAIAKWPVWIADWGVKTPDLVHWKEYAAWQYTDKESVDGINGAVDGDKVIVQIQDKPKPKPKAKPKKKQDIPKGTPYIGERFKISGRYERNEEVKDLQHCLNEIYKQDGYKKIADDGVFGPETQGAVIAFQRHSHIGIDGIYGPQTEGKLKEALK